VGCGVQVGFCFFSKLEIKFNGNGNGNGNG